MPGSRLARRQIPRQRLEEIRAGPQQRLSQAAGIEPLLVVTVYRTSKIEKYWRPE